MKRRVRGWEEVEFGGILLCPVATIDTDLLVRTGQDEAEWMRQNELTGNEGEDDEEEEEEPGGVIKR